MPALDSVLDGIGRTPLGLRPENAGKTVVAVLPDTGRNYLSKIYNDAWMRELTSQPLP